MLFRNGKITSRLLVVSLAAAALATVAEARQPSPQQCAYWQQQLAEVQSRLRAGYRAQEGNRLRERRRQLQNQLASCPRQWRR